MILLNLLIRGLITGAIYRSEVYLYDIFGNEIGNLFIELAETLKKG